MILHNWALCYYLISGNGVYCIGKNRIDEPEKKED